MGVRYIKGSVNLSLDRDNALLKQVFDSGFITQPQLWEFMLHAGHEFRRRSFNWRVKRLVDNGFLERHALPRITSSFVYTLTAAGAQELINLHQCHAGAASFYKRQPECESVVHALDLNDLHLALLRAGVLNSWKSDLEVRSQNEFTRYGHVKDYDAVIMLQTNGQEVELALEYERSAKSDMRYQEIAAKIRQELRVHRFLYLVPDYHRLYHVRQFFVHTGRDMYFGVTCDFEREALKTQVVGLKAAYRSLEEALHI
jgi:Replication-relaxation